MTEKTDSSQINCIESSEEEMPGTELIRFILSFQESGKRLDKMLAERFHQYSRSRIQRWIEDGYVTVDGSVVPAKQIMRGNEEITVLPQQPEEERAFEPEPVKFPVVFEDDSILVVNKPAGLVVHPAAGHWSGTLLNGLLYAYPQNVSVPRAGIVHRLDKETSGLMVVAKTIEAQTNLVRQLQARTVRREYLALVLGVPPEEGTIDQPIGRHPRDRIKMAVLQSASGKAAVTHYRRLQTGECQGTPVSLIRCRLETGRTHQIRVHMQFAGYPLVGDPLYGKQHMAFLFPRQALHAFRLGLLHPSEGKPYEWRVPMPEDMKILLAESQIVEKEKWYGTNYS